jgi:predicted ATPase/DNA-binding winged helix-turn-helix (wHTH) protein
MTDMNSPRYVVFGRYRLDRADGRLWRGTSAVRLTRKAHGMLSHLVAHAGQLVTKEELLAAVWPRTVVVEGVLTTVVRELRRALEDPTRTPAFIQTVHRQGYRFIAPVTACDVLPAASETGASRLFVGRESEWRQLQGSFAAAFNGTRQVVFLAGEAGIGKTAIIDEFIAHLAAQSAAVIMRGQCIEHYGMGEAYLPILEALSRLGRDDEVSSRELLSRYAPDWLAHLPSLQRAPQQSPESPSRVSATRMLRELSEALEQLASRQPVILVLEDLHWSDTATLDWLAHFARRRDRARLLVLATYRPVEVIVNSHPLRAIVGELQRQDRCTQVMLDYLPPAALQEYLERRFAGLSATAELAELLHRRTSGQPLFFVTIAETLLREQMLVCEQTQWKLRGPLSGIADVLPSSVSELVEQQVDTLPQEDQAILDAASVAGESFDAALLAAAGGFTEEQVETRGERWMRQHRFLDRTSSARFRFRHAVFQDALYRRIPASRRARLHRSIGQALVAAHPGDTATIAAEAAVHFERGGDIAAAISCLEQAANRSIHRSAYAEALAHVRKALELAQHCPESAELSGQRARLQACLATALMATKGWADEEVERAHLQAKELCGRVGDTTREIGALWGLIAVSVVRAELQQTRLLSVQLLELTREHHQIPFQLAGHMELAGVAFGVGDLGLADREFAIADALYDPAQHADHLARTSCDQGVLLRSWWSHLCWHRGQNERALALSNDALSLSASFGHPLTRAIALSYAAILQQFRRNTAGCAELAADAIALCTEHGLAYYRTWGQIVASWCLSQKTEAPEQASRIEESIGDLRAGRARRCLPYFHALLAEAHLRCGDRASAAAALAAGIEIVGATGECWWASELWRLKGEIALAQRPVDVSYAQEHLQTAVAVAERCDSPPLIGRARADLAHLA